MNAYVPTTRQIRTAVRRVRTRPTGLPFVGAPSDHPTRHVRRAQQEGKRIPMRAKRTATGAALAAGALAVTGLALAPSAAAVTPQSATITASCGIFGGGTATLTATQSGTSATLSLTSTAISAPVTVAADSITSTLTMAKAGGGSVVFSGTKNPVMNPGDPVSVGPLAGTVASGYSLDAYGGSLKMVIFGVTVTCTASGHQSPGPFVF